MSPEGYRNLNNNTTDSSSPSSSPEWWSSVRDWTNSAFNSALMRPSFFRPSPNKLVSASSLNHRYSRRYLKYSAIAFAIYFILGLGYYMGHLHYSFLDAIYFIIVVFLTIGYGDFYPLSNPQRAFLIFYIIIGFIILCLVGITIGDLIAQREAYIQAKSSKKALTIITRAKFDRVNHTKSGDERRLSSMSASLETNRLSTEIFPTPYSIRDPQVLEVMRRVNMDLIDEQLKDIESSTRRNIAIILVIIAVGAFAIGVIEEWDATESIYWSLVTTTTLGFGDIVPVTEGGRAFTIIFALVAVGLLAKAVTDVARYPFVMRNKKIELQVMMQFGTQLNEAQLKSIRDNELSKMIPGLRRDASKIEKSEFVLIMLKLMNKLSEVDVAYISEIFDALDQNSDGFLSSAMMQAQIEEAQARAAGSSVGSAMGGVAPTGGMPVPREEGRRKNNKASALLDGDVRVEVDSGVLNTMYSEAAPGASRYVPPPVPGSSGGAQVVISPNLTVNAVSSAVGSGQGPQSQVSYNNNSNSSATTRSNSSSSRGPQWDLSSSNAEGSASAGRGGGRSGRTTATRSAYLDDNAL